jgi:hypothetical protein
MKRTCEESTAKLVCAILVADAGAMTTAADNPVPTRNSRLPRGTIPSSLNE